MMSDEDIKEHHALDRLKGIKNLINTTISLVNSSRTTNQGPGSMT